MTGVAIDIGWFLTIDECDDWDIVNEATNFLGRMLDQNIPLLQDYEGHIRKEYQTYLRETQLGKAFSTKVNDLQQVSYAPAKPLQACHSCLVSIGFDPSDAPYVGVASRVGGFYLTHEEKHLEPSRVAAILASCGVHVIGSGQLHALTF